MANWNELFEALRQSPNKVEICKSESDGYKIIEQMGIGENTTIGLIILNCSMLRINGYLRIWGSGNNTTHRNFVDGNNELRGYFGGNKVVVADDIWGGCFAINNGDFSGSPQYLWYYAPDTLQWENLEITYSQFIYWAIGPDIQGFYKSFLWDNTRTLLDQITFSQGLSIYPPLWTKECDSKTASVRIIPMNELVKVNIEIAKQLD